MKWWRNPPSGGQEIRNLLAIINRELRDDDSALSLDGRFIHAFWASLCVARAALRASGYRLRSTAHHYLAIESLEYTLGLDAGQVHRLQAFRAKRARAEYEMTDVVTDTEHREARQLAEDLRQALVAWLRAEHPRLLPA